MSTDDRPNPLGHIRFPHSFDPGTIAQKVEEAQKLANTLAGQYAAYRPPQLDLAAIESVTKRFDTMVKSSTDYAARLEAMLDASRKSWEQTQKTVESIVKSSSFLAALEHSRLVAEKMSEALLHLPDFTKHLSILQDRIIFKDIVLPDTFMPPAGECREYGTMLPVEEIIREDIILDPVDIAMTTTCHVDVGAPETKEQDISPVEVWSTGEKASAPIFLQKLNLVLQEKLFDVLPPEADLIDETIALFEPRKAGIFILTQQGWLKEEEGVTAQGIRVIQYLRRIGKRPGQPCASLTELASALAKRAASIRTSRSSISNRIARIEEICMEHNLKPIVIRSGGLWRINSALTHWDTVTTKPWIHY
jgi:hypothetical protein